MKQRHVVKHNHHTGEYGVYDNATRTIRWGMNAAVVAPRPHARRTPPQTRSIDPIAAPRFMPPPKAMNRRYQTTRRIQDR